MLFLSTFDTTRHTTHICEFGFNNNNNIIRCRGYDRGYCITNSLSYYDYRYTSCGIRSTWAYQRPPDLPAKDVALAAVIERLPPGTSRLSLLMQCRSARASRNPPTGPDQLRPTARGVRHALVCRCPLVSNILSKYNNIIIIIINIHHHCKNAGTLDSCVVWIVRRV